MVIIVMFQKTTGRIIAFIYINSNALKSWSLLGKKLAALVFLFRCKIAPVFFIYGGVLQAVCSWMLRKIQNLTGTKESDGDWVCGCKWSTHLDIFQASWWLSLQLHCKNLFAQSHKKRQKGVSTRKYSWTKQGEKQLQVRTSKFISITSNKEEIERRWCLWWLCGFSTHE